MARQQIFEGTWEQLVAQSDRFSNQLRLVVFSTEPLQAAPDMPIGQHFYEEATPEEFARAFDAIGQGNEHLPVLPPEAFERESLYEEIL